MQQILAELCESHNCGVLCIQETNRGHGAVRDRFPDMNLFPEIAHEHYGNALFIRYTCTCQPTSESSTNNIEIIQAILSGFVSKQLLEISYPAVWLQN